VNILYLLTRCNWVVHELYWKAGLNGNYFATHITCSFCDGDNI